MSTKAAAAMPEEQEGRPTSPGHAATKKGHLPPRVEEEREEEREAPREEEEHEEEEEQQRGARTPRSRGGIAPSPLRGLASPTSPVAAAAAAAAAPVSRLAHRAAEAAQGAAERAAAAAPVSRLAHRAAEAAQGAAERAAHEAAHVAHEAAARTAVPRRRAREATERAAASAARAGPTAGLAALAVVLFALGLYAAPWLAALPPLRLLPFVLGRRAAAALRSAVALAVRGALPLRAELRLWRTFGADNAVVSAGLLASRVAAPLVAAALALPGLLLLPSTPAARQQQRQQPPRRSMWWASPPASLWGLMAPFALACAGLGPGATLLLPALWLSGSGKKGAGASATPALRRRPSLLLLRAADSRALPLAALLLIALVWSAAEVATGQTWAQARALVWPPSSSSFAGRWGAGEEEDISAAAGWLARLLSPTSSAAGIKGSVFLRWAAADAIVGALFVLPWLAYCDARLRLGGGRPPQRRRTSTRSSPAGATVGGGGAHAATVAAGAGAAVRLVQESAPSFAVAVWSAALPLLGPCLYALVRPQLTAAGLRPGQQQQEEDERGGDGLWLGERLLARARRSLGRSARWAADRAPDALQRGGGGGGDLAEEAAHEAGGFEDEDETSELSSSGVGEEEGEGEAAAPEEEGEEPHAEEAKAEEEGPVVAGHVLRRRRGQEARA